MPIQVLMPQLGESVSEATVTKWLKTVGDRIEEYEPLLEVNTDKVDTEVPSPAAGVLRAILVEPNTTVQVGTLLAEIAAEGEQPAEAAVLPAPVGAGLVPAHPVPAPSQAAASQPPAAPETPPAGRDRELGFISPIVAKLASEHKLDLFQVTGTGAGGRITKKDVLAYLETSPSATVEAGQEPAPLVPSHPVAAQPAAAQPVLASPTPSPSSPPASRPPTLPGDEFLPHTPVRRSIAEHMVLSERTSPHVTTVMEADLSRIVAHRLANKDAFARDGVNLTFTAYFIAAAVAALKAYPVVNSSWSDDGLVLHHQINIGMATSLGEDGLIVPVIKNADSLSLLGLARTVNDLANRARARKLTPDEVRGGTLTLTNHGISGSLFATPIINQPQCGILGVGAIQKRAVVITSPDGSDSIAIRPMAYLSLTFDHRILDGAIADYWLGKVVESLQNWK